ncbi:substrate-binding and VWA domain-containing protein [Actinomadura miaoliensis]|uniref:Substrate-binding and VWA domain-containing protein n=1 Tax=Actinomadura miaoliensis TaxID=430685 RepID=A0ABP7WHQ6_9ACTN
MSVHRGHRARRAPSRHPVRAMLAATAGLVVLTGVGAYALTRAAGCAVDDRLTLDVAAAPELAPALHAAADRFALLRHRVDGRCVRARVRAADPAAMTTLLTGQGVVPGTGARPDVWIPDSALWTSLVRTAPGGGRPFQPRPTSVARSPIVVGVPRAAAPPTPQTSWDRLLEPAAAVAGADRNPRDAQEPRNPADAEEAADSPSAQAARPRVPDPARSATGLAALVVADNLLAGVPERQAVFTGLVRAVRENAVPSVSGALAEAARGRPGTVLASEQAVFAYNRSGPPHPASALYPAEGTVWLDYPFTITTGDRDRARAARLLEDALTDERTAAELRAYGFRTSWARGPASFGPGTGTQDGSPRALPPPAPADVRRIVQSYARLSLSTRLLVLFDISGSMAEKVAPGVDRLQATAAVAQTGLQLLADDSELGVWVFSTHLKGDQDWVEQVPLAPLGERIGSVTHRQRILSQFGRLEAERGGDTGLYDSLLAAFRLMRRTYKPEMVNTVLVFTDGRNEDDEGASFEETLAGLRREYDPRRPVQVILQGYGEDVAVEELEGLAQATRGIVQIAHTPEESKRLLLEAMSRRVCTPDC